MNCPICQAKTKVLDSRHTTNRTKRLRECKQCLTRFSTYEGLDFTSIPDYLKEQVAK